jgi:Protein of unknown function (DUF1553)/Protein of unknown function (DUF1549)
MIPPQISSIAHTALALGVVLFSAMLPVRAFSAEIPTAQPAPVSFVNEVVPILTKLGCNGGTCHGKATGQNGFKLSLFGFEPDEDYEHLVYEQRGRRLTPSAPEESLLLTKGAASVPHGGGRRLEHGTPTHNTLSQWIAQGMPNDLDDPARPRLLSIEVLPKGLLMKAGASQTLKVTACFSDGSIRDITQFASLEVNTKGMAAVDENSATFTMGTRPGSVSVMARYQDKVSIFRATLPVGAPVQELPPEQNFIDKAIFNRLREIGMPPSPLCDDSTFLRRVTLDLAGRLPSAEEARLFIADAAPDKRASKIDVLLESPEYADTFANYWSALLRNRRGDVPNTRDPSHIHGNFAFHGWIRESLYHNKPYDKFVRELLTAAGNSSDSPAVTWYRQVNTQIQQTEDTAQLFLGVRIQCAQCHHHPYEQWSQRDYYSLGAYFSQLDRVVSKNQMAEFIVSVKRTEPQATHKKTGEKLLPAAIGSAAPPLSADDDARTALADWLVEKSNPYFSKAIVNRYWKILFNRGFVDPEDDMRDTNPPSHPELLEALSIEFRNTGYDLKKLLRLFANSSTYQLASAPNAHNTDDSQYFSRYYARRLSAEQLLDAVNAVTGTIDNWANQPAATRAVQLPDSSYNTGGILREFGRPDSSTACTCERQSIASLGQSLLLATSDQIQNKLAANTGTARKLAKDSTRGNSEKLEELYLLAFARIPTQTETEVALRHLNTASAAKDPTAAIQNAWEDLLWATLSSGEFLLNH